MMPNGVRFIGGLWYVDGDDAEGRKKAGLLWRKLMVRLAGTHLPYLEAALVNLREWWQQWHGHEGEYQAEVAADAFESEILIPYDLAALGWARKGFDSWEGGGEFNDGLVLVEDYKVFITSQLNSTEELPKLASFLDKIEPRQWVFLPEDMKMWVEWDGAGGGDQVLDHLGDGAEGMQRWAELKIQRVWKQFRDKVCEKGGGRFSDSESGKMPGWVREWCEKRKLKLSEENPCMALLRNLRTENRRRKLWKRVAVALGVVLLAGVVIIGTVQYAQELKAFESAKARLKQTTGGELEKLADLEADLKLGGGGMFFRSQWNALRFEIMSRLDEELEGLKREAETQKRHGHYLDAARVCVRIAVCLRQRGEDSGEWEDKERKCRDLEQELAERLERAKTFLEASDYEAARKELNALERLVADEARAEQKLIIRERVNWEPQLVKRFENLKRLANPSRTIGDWQRALDDLNALEKDLKEHPAVAVPSRSDLAEQRRVLERRLKTWNDVNTIYEVSLDMLKSATPVSMKRRKNELTKNLEACLDRLDGIYNENGGQPCGGPKMENLYQEINQTLIKLREAGK